MKTTNFSRMLLALALAWGVGGAVTASADIKSDICTRFFACGTFEGPIGQRNADNTFVPGDAVERTIVTQTGDNQAVIDMVITAPSSQPQSWHLDVVFQDNGQFLVTSHGRFYAIGVCKDLVCTYGMIPFDLGEGLTGNSGIFRFTEKKFERLMLVRKPTETLTQISLLDQK